MAIYMYSFYLFYSKLWARTKVSNFLVPRRTDRLSSMPSTFTPRLWMWSSWSTRRFSTRSRSLRGGFLFALAITKWKLSPNEGCPKYPQILMFPHFSRKFNQSLSPLRRQTEMMWKGPQHVPTAAVEQVQKQVERCVPKYARKKPNVGLLPGSPVSSWVLVSFFDLLATRT